MNAADLIGWQNPRRRETVSAALLSAFLHLLLILSIAALLGLRPPLSRPSDQAEDPPEFTLIAPPLPPPPALPEKPAFADTSTVTPVEAPPDQPAFESDRSTVAASELPASGVAPVPTMEGVTAPGIDLANRRFTAGPQTAPSDSPPQETAEETREAGSSMPKEVPRPEVQSMPTPRPSSQLALLDPPAPAKQPPAPKAPSAYQPESRITRLRGNISNRGRASVAANATPLGRFKKQVSDAIGSRWHYYVREQSGLVSVGTVEVAFIIRKDGSVEGARVSSNTSNESLAACSLQSVLDAELPAIPAELSDLVPSRGLEIEFTFTVLSN